MDFFVSRVPRPPAVILHAKGDIGGAGQEILRDAIIAELTGTCPIILNVRDTRFDAMGQVSGPILNALACVHYSGGRARQVAVVGADHILREFLDGIFGCFLLVCETEEQALKALGVRGDPRGEEFRLYHFTRPTSMGRELDREEYLLAFERWFLVLETHESYQRMVPEFRKWWSEVIREYLPARASVGEFCKRMPGLPHRLHQAVLKSNLLFRMLYLGEPVRTRRCPGMKSGSGDQEVVHHPPQCRCGGCRWLP